MGCRSPMLTQCLPDEKARAAWRCGLKVTRCCFHLRWMRPWLQDCCCPILPLSRLTARLVTRCSFLTLYGPDTLFLHPLGTPKIHYATSSHCYQSLSCELRTSENDYSYGVSSPFGGRREGGSILIDSWSNRGRRIRTLRVVGLPKT